MLKWLEIVHERNVLIRNTNDFANRWVWLVRIDGVCGWSVVVWLVSDVSGCGGQTSASVVSQ